MGHEMHDAIIEAISVLENCGTLRPAESPEDSAFVVFDAADISALIETLHDASEHYGITK